MVIISLPNDNFTCIGCFFCLLVECADGFRGYVEIKVLQRELSTGASKLQFDLAGYNHAVNART